MARILVVDDDFQVRLVLEKMLVKNGYDVVLADNGDEGLKHFRNEQFDLVLTDIIMPEKDGIELIRIMKKERPDAKIIAFSGGGRLGTEDYLEVSKKFGANEVLTKPVDKSTILGCIKGLILSE